jgi:8-oxo-dGTP pyrophosphatase MutT (NUDIX family)
MKFPSILRKISRKVARGFIYDPDKNLFLITKGALPPFDWHLPGGGISKRESAEAALLRELKEELCLNENSVMSIVPMHIAYDTVMLIPHEMHMFFMTVKPWDIRLSWELREAKWITLDELTDYFDENMLGGVRALC